jgi:hypothetical protein
MTSIMVTLMMEAARILEILDQCCDDYSFPMLDNGYVYLAATRLSLYRSPEDWALVIEVFGYSTRALAPDTGILTFASRLHNRSRPEDFVNRKSYENYLAHHPHNEFRVIGPIEPGDWQDPESSELVAVGAQGTKVRGRMLKIPDESELVRHQIYPQRAPRLQIFELCRYLAAVARNDILANSTERRVSIRPEMEQILQLEEWNHPDLANQERASSSPTFEQLAKVLETGDVRLYSPILTPNTHWKNWPAGGTL